MAEDRKDETDKAGQADETASSAPSGLPRRKKRPATIDLEATEVSTAAPEQPSDQAAPEAAETPSAAQADTARDETPSGESDDAPQSGADAASPEENKVDETAAEQSAADQDTAASPSPPPAGAGTGTVIAAAVLGAIAATIGVLVLGLSGLLPQAQPDISRLEVALEQRLAQLDARLQEGQSGGDLETIRTQLETVSSRLNDTQGLADTVAALSQKIDAAEAAANDARSQIGGLTDTLASAGTADGDAAAAVAGLAQQIAALKEDVAGLASASQSQADLAAKDAEIDVLRERVDELEAAPQENVEAARAAAAATAANALTLAALERAVLSGRNYGSELEAAQVLAGDDPAFADLAAHAQAGVATRSELTQQFDALAGKIVAAEKPASGEGVLARIMDRAGSIVQVRPVGYVDGDGAAAAVARAEVALEEGDLEGALSELGLLEGSARQTAEPFIARLEARLAAEKAVAALNAAAVARLNDIGATSDADNNNAESGGAVNQ